MFFPSTNVKIFPCANRGYKEIENGTEKIKVVYNPESRFTTEYNLTSHLPLLAPNGAKCYVYSAPDAQSNVWVLSFHGYRFDITNDSNNNTIQGFVIAVKDNRLAPLSINEVDKKIQSSSDICLDTSTGLCLAIYAITSDAEMPTDPNCFYLPVSQTWQALADSDKNELLGEASDSAYTKTIYGTRNYVDDRVTFVLDKMLDKSTYNSYIVDKTMSDTQLKLYADTKAVNAASLAKSELYGASTYTEGLTLIALNNQIKNLVGDSTGEGAPTNLAAETAARQAADMELQKAINTTTEKVITLVDEDAGKSVRTIAAEELAIQLIPTNAAEALNSLEEIAAWIQSHPKDASAMNEAIVALQKQLKDIAAGEGTVKKYIEDAIIALKIGDYAKAADLTALAAKVTTLEGEMDTVEGRIDAVEAKTQKGSATTAGIVRVDGETITAVDGVISAKQYELPKATASTLGGVKIGNNINVATDGTISIADAITYKEATTTVAGLMSTTDKIKLDAIVVDSSLDAESSNPVANKAVKVALDGKVDKAALDAYMKKPDSIGEVTSGNEGLVTGGQVYNALQTICAENALYGIAFSLNGQTVPDLETAPPAQLWIRGISKVESLPKLPEDFVWCQDAGGNTSVTENNLNNGSCTLYVVKTSSST